ncbi:MAG TPA: GxxExxY protein [Gemmatimonadaceae bacterium]|nr:GxxExxY protein [Gemmatimonadaceae bacterium]
MRADARGSFVFIQALTSVALLHRRVTEVVIGAFYEVYNELGYGFLEVVYTRALELELKARGLSVQREQPIQVWYKEQEVGLYRADLLVNDAVLVEVKASRHIDPSAHSQLVHYLTATRLDVGLLLHFGLDPFFKRVVLSTHSRAK